MEVLSETRICASIQAQLVLEFDYDGRHRRVHPYCHGITTKGVESLRAIQVGGDSRSGGFGFGKLWAVDRMTSVRVSTERFVADDPSYNPRDSAMAVIHCGVKPA